MTRILFSATVLAVPPERSELSRGARLCFGLNPQRSQRFRKRLGLQHHAFAAAKGAVVHGAMPVMREGAQIVHAHFDQPLGHRPAQDPILEEPGEEAGKDGDDVKAHRLR